MSSPGTLELPYTGSKTRNRWVQLFAGVGCMVAVANIQYAWTLFVPEIQETFNWSRATITVAFTVYVLIQTWLTPVLGHFIDRYGPRYIIMAGALAAAAAWIINSYALTLTGFYIGAAFGGIGVGCVNAAVINNALKWFPDKRGLAAGITSAGFGAGTLLTIMPISMMIQSSGYQDTFFFFGVLQGLAIFGCALLIRAPTSANEVTYSSRLAQSRYDYTLKEALRTPVFYVLMGMFICTVTGGLMAVAQLSVIARDYGVHKFPVDLYFFTVALLPLALILDRVMNGISRPMFGWISDHIGREKTMFIAFSLEGCGIIALALYGHNPWAFLILSGVVFLAWGEVYSLFSATAGDAFGTKHIGKIYGTLFLAKGFAALLVPLSNVLMEATGTWSSVLFTVAALDLTAAVAAVTILKPLLKRHHSRTPGGGGKTSLAV